MLPLLHGFVDKLLPNLATYATNANQIQQPFLTTTITTQLLNIAHKSLQDFRATAITVKVSMVKYSLLVALST